MHAGGGDDVGDAMAPPQSAAASSAAANKRARSGSTSASRKRREAATQANVVATSVHATSATAGTDAGSVKTRETRAGFALGYAIARLNVEQARGLHYWQQCKAAGRFAGSEEPAVPLPADTPVEDAYAFRNVRPVDQRLPERLDNDTLIFAFVTARAESVSRARVSAAKERQSARYPFQATINGALRAYLCSALHRFPALRRELCARINWNEWEATVAQTQDYLRCSLSAQCEALGARPGVFLSHYASYAYMNTSRQLPINNMYKLTPQPFSEVVEVAIDKLLVNKGAIDLPADLVEPVESGIILLESLYRLDYPRSNLGMPQQQQQQASETNTASGGADDASTTATESTANNATTTAQPRMPPAPSPYVLTQHKPPLPPFTIEPTRDVPADNATLADVQRDFRDRARVPLRAFRATGRTIDDYNAAMLAYNTRGSIKVVDEYVEALAAQSMYQLQIMHTFVRCVNTYMKVYTMVLPEYLEEPLNDLLCREFQLPDPDMLPPHALRQYVCLRCRRAAMFTESARERNMAGAIGAKRVKVVETTNNMRAIDRVLRRGHLLAPDQLAPANKSLYAALYRRAFQAPSIYEDSYCNDPLTPVPPTTRWAAARDRKSVV
jgi:hypothetical protein